MSGAPETAEGRAQLQAEAPQRGQRACFAGHGADRDAFARLLVQLRDLFHVDPQLFAADFPPVICRLGRSFEKDERAKVFLSQREAIAAATDASRVEHRGDNFRRGLLLKDSVVFTMEKSRDLRDEYLYAVPVFPSSSCTNSAMMPRTVRVLSPVSKVKLAVWPT
nr:hypothetical protein [Polyangium fumosum]